jgi:hypothetical protein
MDYISYAKWFGIVSILLALGILFNIENSRKLAAELIDSASGYIVGGVLPLIFGSWVITQHTQWIVGWPMVVTLAGWFMLLAGVFRLWFVNTWRHLMKANLDKIPFLFSLFGLMLGLLLIYVGFAHLSVR